MADFLWIAVQVKVLIMMEAKGMELIHDII